MALRDEVAQLLGLAALGPVKSDVLRQQLEPRARRLWLAGPQLAMPEWASGAHSEHDVYMELAEPLIGARLWDDARGFGSSAELAVATGTLAEVEAVVGAMSAPPPRPGGERFSRRTCYVESSGQRIRVDLDHVEGAAKRVTLTFPPAEWSSP